MKNKASDKASSALDEWAFAKTDDDEGKYRLTIDEATSSNEMKKKQRNKE